jgi:hypothetical protein
MTAYRVGDALTICNRPLDWRRTEIEARHMQAVTVGRVTSYGGSLTFYRLDCVGGARGCYRPVCLMLSERELKMRVLPAAAVQTQAAA